MRTTVAVLAVALTVGSGCHSSDLALDWAIPGSKAWSAERAWRNRRWMYDGVPCEANFKAGFKAGFRFACGGYDSCEAPPMPRRSWHITGPSEADQEETQAWSDGFTHGTLAAQQDSLVGASQFELAAAQAPEGTPDVNYYTPPPNGLEGIGQGLVPTQVPLGLPTAVPEAPNAPAFAEPPQASERSINVVPAPPVEPPPPSAPPAAAGQTAKSVPGPVIALSPAPAAGPGIGSLRWFAGFQSWSRAEVPTHPLSPQGDVGIRQRQSRAEPAASSLTLVAGRQEPRAPAYETRAQQLPPPLPRGGPPPTRDWQMPLMRD